MFDLEQFTADCRAALKEDSSHKSVREVLARAVTDPSGIVKTLGFYRAKVRPIELVMPGLEPGIHVFGAILKDSRGWPGQARP